MNKSFPVVFLLLSVHRYSDSTQFLGVPSQHRSGGITKCAFCESISGDDPDEFPGSGGSGYGHSVRRYKQEKSSPLVHRESRKELGNEVTDSKISQELQYPRFADERWKKGTWALNMFVRNGRMDWDAVIIAGRPKIPPTGSAHPVLTFEESPKDTTAAVQIEGKRGIGEYDQRKEGWRLHTGRSSPQVIGAAGCKETANKLKNA
ncbi:chlorophyll A-B binding family protein, partial [Striga asiatica]